MDLFGLGFVAEQLHPTEKPEGEQRGTDERKGDIHRRCDDCSERQEIQQKARAKRSHCRTRRLSSGELIRAVEKAIERRLGIWGLVLVHHIQLIAASAAAARIGMRKISRAENQSHPPPVRTHTHSHGANFRWHVIPTKNMPDSCFDTSAPHVPRESSAMNYSTLESHWDVIKAQLKQRYAQLTDDDLKFVTGKGEELAARLREKLSMSAHDLETMIEDLKSSAGGRVEQIKAKVAGFAHDVSAKVGTAIDHAKATGAAAVDEVKAQAGAAYDGARRQVRSLHEDGEEYVRANPRQSLVAALCAGFVIGLLIRR